MTYTVQSGDSLWAIARKLNVSVDEIRRANNMKGNSLSLGQNLKIPGKSAAAPARAASGGGGSAPSSFAKEFNIGFSAGKSISEVAYPSAKELASIKKHRAAVFNMNKQGVNYTIAFKDYRMATQTVKFKEGVKSSFAVYDKGVSYPGTQVHKIPASYYKTLGISPKLARILEFVSANEGKYDAINSYDRAFFSFGFVQFAGGNRSLHTLMALMKYRKADVFYDAFMRFGIDVEYKFANNRFSGHQICVKIPEGAGGQHMLRGEDAEKHLRANKLLHGVYIRAGYDPEVAKLQVMMAVYEYANPAFRRTITINGQKAKTVDFIRSEAGITALIDMSVNKGVGGAAKLFQTSIQACAQRLGLRSLQDIYKIDEATVLRHMISSNSDSRIKTRVGKALKHFSAAK